MSHFRLRRLSVIPTLVALLAFHPAAIAAERTFKDGRFEKAELRYVNDLPVLLVEGTPEEIGRQKAALTGDVLKAVADYPKKLLKSFGREDRWPKLVEMARALAPQFPPDHAAELRTMGQQTGVDRDTGLVANTLPDIYRGSIACSSLIVEPEMSQTNGPLFGRNLDFRVLGVLDRYTLVTAYRPKGKRAFVAVSFPGQCGVLSGMNDAGLAVAVHEVYVARDRAEIFDDSGVPYTLAFRRVLEECATIDEAVKLLEEIPRTTLLNLAACDRRGGAVIEMTPKTVAVRRGKDGVVVCTNHFRTPELIVLALCRRYQTLVVARKLPSLGVKEVAEKLHEVNQGHMTVHSMIFEPEPQVLHLAFGDPPATARPLKRLDVKRLFEAGFEAKGSVGAGRTSATGE